MHVAQLAVPKFRPQTLAVSSSGGFSEMPAICRH
jgi:hypothetical protein